MTIVGWLKNAITLIVAKFSILNSIDCMCWIFCHFRFRYCVYGKIDAWFVCAVSSFLLCMFIGMYHAKWQCCQRPMVPMAWKWRLLHQLVLFVEIQWQNAYYSYVLSNRFRSRYICFFFFPFHRSHIHRMRIIKRYGNMLIFFCWPMILFLIDL